MGERRRIGTDATHRAFKVMDMDGRQWRAHCRRLRNVASLMDKLDVRTRAGLATIATANLGTSADRRLG
jgi:hypothetical protein